MNKRTAASRAAFLLLAALILFPVIRVDATTYTKIFSAWIQGSLIDSTPIGSTTPSTGAFTTASASGGFVGSLTGNASTATALAATPSNCGATSGLSYGIAAGGNALCNANIVPQTCNANGCYYVTWDGTYIEYGISPAATSGCSGVCATGTITWPHSFPTAIQTFVPVAIGCAVFPCASGAHPLSAVDNGKNNTTGTIYFDASGQTITVPAIQADWFAIGK